MINIDERLDNADWPKRVPDTLAALELKTLGDNPGHEFHGNQYRDAFGTSDPYVYHISSASIPLMSFERSGIKPSKTGISGPGVYMAHTPEKTQYYEELDKGRLFRIDKQKLIQKFGRYPDDPNGVEYDNDTGEVILGGERSIPREFIQVKHGEGWRALGEQAGHAFHGNQWVNHAPGDVHVVPQSAIPSYDPDGHYPLYHFTSSVQLDTIMGLGVGVGKDWSTLHGTTSLEPNGTTSWTRDPHYAVHGSDSDVRLTVADKQDLGVKTTPFTAALAVDHTGDAFVAAPFEHEERVPGIVSPDKITDITISKATYDQWAKLPDVFRGYMKTEVEKAQAETDPKRKARLESNLALSLASNQRSIDKYERILNDPRLHVGMSIRSDLVTDKKGSRFKSTRDLALFDTSDAKHSGLLVALHLDDATARALAVPSGEDPSDLHITLCYSGDVATIGDLSVARAIVAVNEICHAHAPLQGVTTDLGRFDATEHSDDLDVIIAHVNIPGLFDLRQRLADALTAAGAPPLSNFAYTPHITLAYVSVGSQPPIDRVPTLPLTFSEVRITIGDQTTDVPFGLAPRNLRGWMRHLLNRVAGGVGSGNFGHSGRPGEVGGSASPSGSAILKDSVDPLDVAARERKVSWTRARAAEVAKRMNFDPSKIDVVDATPRQFFVGGQSFDEAGHYDPDTGRVQINARQVSRDTGEVQKLVAHEITHDAFHVAYDRWNQIDKYDALPPPAVENLSAFIADNMDRLVADDGVTDYSRAYWEDVRRMNPQSIDVGTWTPDTGGNVGADVPTSQVTGWVNQDTGEWREQPPPVEKRHRQPLELDEGTPGYRAWYRAMNETLAEISSLDEIGGGHSVAHYKDESGKQVSVPRVAPVWREAHDKLFAAYRAAKEDTEVMTRGGFKKV